MRKLLTHLIILSLTVLPVQVISADVKNSAMKMSMNKLAQVEQKCMHTSVSDSEEVLTITAACCDDSSHQCESCGNCPQAASAMIVLSSYHVEKAAFLNTQKFFISHLLLNGVPQKNLLKPPRIFI